MEQLILPVDLDLDLGPEQRPPVQTTLEVEEELVARMAEAIVAVHRAAGGPRDECAT